MYSSGSQYIIQNLNTPQNPKHFSLQGRAVVSGGRLLTPGVDVQGSRAWRSGGPLGARLG